MFRVFLICQPLPDCKVVTVRLVYRVQVSHASRHYRQAELRLYHPLRIQLRVIMLFCEA